MPEIIFENYGYCQICKEPVKFQATNSWFRDNYICTKCGSLPRERALMYVLDNFFPNWQNLRIHESSPVERGASIRIKNEGKKVVQSQYFPDTPSGITKDNWLCEDLERLSFPDNSLDIHITQDVIEHIFDPELVFKEIARTLAPNGAHVFTVPLLNRSQPSVRCAIKQGGEIIHLINPPEFHGNPVSEKGSLVTFHWGFDIVHWIYKLSGLITTIFYIDAIELGIKADLIEVLVSRKLTERIQH
jgi:SAM-dependent methyltransferase